MLLETDRDSEFHAPSRSEVDDDLEHEQFVRELLHELYRELVTHRINPFQEMSEVHDDKEIVHPEILFEQFYEIQGRIRQIHDREARQKLEKEIEGLDARVLDVYEPYVAQQVFRMGARLFADAQREGKHRRTDEDLRQTRSEIAEALQYIQYWKNSEEKKASLSSILRYESDRLSQYEREPYLWGCEEQIHFCFRVLEHEWVSHFVDRLDETIRFGNAEDFVQIPATIIETLQTAKRYREEMHDPEMIAWIDQRLHALTTQIRSLQEIKQSYIARQKGQSVERTEFGTEQWAREVLGVGDDADEDRIKNAYRKLVMEHHPDRVPEDQREKATERLKELNRALSVLRR